MQPSLSPELPNSRAFQQRLFSLLQDSDSAFKLRQVHAQILTNGISRKGFLIGKLVSLYALFGCSRLALRALNEIESPNTLLWNQMIRLSNNADDVSSPSPVEVYNRLRRSGSSPDGYSYSFTLKRCIQSRLWREGQQLHGRVICDGYYSNVVVGTGLVNFYAAAGAADDHGDEMVDACNVFEEMSERNVVAWNSLLCGYIRYRDVEGAMRVFDNMPERTVVSWTTIILGCAHNGRCKSAVSLFNQMRRDEVEIDSVALIAALSACAELGDLNLGRRIHSYAKKSNWGGKSIVGLPVTLLNSLIHMYSSCGEVEAARGVFEEVPRKTVVSWTTMIIGYAKHGFVDHALTLFEGMQTDSYLGSSDSEVRPDAITFIGVLCACSHGGHVERGRSYFKEMKDRWGIEPRIEHYGCMVDLFSRAGLLDEALKLVESMPMKPNDAIWGALLGGCRIYKNNKVASLAAQNLNVVELDPDRAIGYLMLLSNVYAMETNWDDVASVRNRMTQIGGGLKLCGRSWVHSSIW